MNSELDPELQTPAGGESAEHEMGQADVVGQSSASKPTAPPPANPVAPIEAGSKVSLPHPFDVVALPSDLTKLQKLVDDVKSRATSNRDWYNRNASVQAGTSRSLRRISVGLVVVGGLCPLVPESLVGFALQPYGYLFLAAAAGAVVFDRAFGYSSSWMRYRIAHMRIERALSLYDNAAATLLAGAELQSETGKNNVRALVAATQTFITSIEDLVVEETEAWLQEFRAEHVSFQQQFGKREVPIKPG